MNRDLCVSVFLVYFRVKERLKKKEGKGGRGGREVANLEREIEKKRGEGRKRGGKFTFRAHEHRNCGLQI
jgi:hypothetical protein